MGRPSKYGDGIVTVPPELCSASRMKRYYHNWYIRNKEKHAARMRLYYRCCKISQVARQRRYNWENSSRLAPPPKNPVKEGDPAAVQEYLEGLRIYKKKRPKIDAIFEDEEETECENTD